ncbi:uncharacterized protein LOC141673740 [Apium graveolens]|uniref:uncharacterized protein LOC141673740 n=1 Tax=Apium graveolens TaxID=4045 RepID=UPI003D799EC7
MKTYNDYLQFGTMPTNNNEARILRMKASRFTIIDGELFKKSSTWLLQRCLKTHDTDMVLRDAHKGECGNHTNGRNLSLKILHLGYYWMTLRPDALDYAKRCDACQRHAPDIHQPSEHLNMSIPSWPFMKWGMDIVGKIPPAPGQKVFMLAMTDYFSKWIEAEAFKQVLSKKCNSKKSTGQTPYSVVYGTEAMLPTEVMIPTARYGLLTSDANNIELSYDKDTVDELREMAKIWLASNQHRVANIYNKHVYIRTFHVGDMVLRKTFQNTMDVMEEKFDDTWEGPYFIDVVVGRGAYQLSSMDGIQVPRSWNALHLKLYHV